MLHIVRYLPVGLAVIFVTACGSSIEAQNSDSTGPIASAISNEPSASPTESDSTEKSTPSANETPGGQGSALTASLVRDFCTSQMPVEALSAAYGARLLYVELSSVETEARAGSLRCQYQTADAQHRVEVGFAHNSEAESSFKYYADHGYPAIKVQGFSVEAYRVLVPGETVDEPLHLVSIPDGQVWYSLRLLRASEVPFSKEGFGGTGDGTFEQYSALARSLVESSPSVPGY